MLALPMVAEAIVDDIVTEAIVLLAPPELTVEDASVLTVSVDAPPPLPESPPVPPLPVSPPLPPVVAVAVASSLLVVELEPKVTVTTSVPPEVTALAPPMVVSVLLVDSRSAGSSPYGEFSSTAAQAATAATAPSQVSRAGQQSERWVRTVGLGFTGSILD
jgi:hypothetical protein